MENRIRLLLIILIVVVIALTITLAGVALAKGHEVSEPDKRNDIIQCKLTADTLVSRLKNVCKSSYHYLVVTFVSDVQCNQSMTVDATDSKPSITYTNAVDDARYTLLMVDPDAGRSSVAELKFYLHWAVTGIKGTDLKSGNVLNGTELEEYFGPHPPSGSGVHRYQFILFKSPDKEEVTLPEEMKRANFELQKFIDNNSICIIEDTYQFKVEVKDVKES